MALLPCALQFASLLASLWIDEFAVRRLGIERPEPRIISVPCCAVRAKDRVLVAHVDVNVRMVVRRRSADAIEFPCPDPNFSSRAVVSELREAACH